MEKWFSVHAIFYFEMHDVDAQDSWLVHENVYLIRAENSVIACEMGERRAKVHEDLSEEGHLVVNAAKASYKFAGIRKVIIVEPHDAGVNILSLNELELTYSVFEVDNFEEVRALVDGKMVNVLYRE